MLLFTRLTCVPIVAFALQPDGVLVLTSSSSRIPKLPDSWNAMSEDAKIEDVLKVVAVGIVHLLIVLDEKSPNCGAQAVQ